MNPFLLNFKIVTLLLKYFQYYKNQKKFLGKLK
jgi:hypothetical protein